MFWYLNLYEKSNGLKYKILKNKRAYQNWKLLETYILYDGKFFTLKTFRSECISYTISKKPMLKKLLEFFKNI